MLDLETTSQEIDLSLAFTYLKQSMTCFMQRRLAEGLELLRRARTELPANQSLFGSRLDALQEVVLGYLRAEQMLHEASRRFADADGEYQSQLVTLQTFLHTLHPSATHMSADLFSDQRQDPFGLSHSVSQMSALMPLSAAEADSSAVLVINCFGRFDVRCSGEKVELCRNLKGQAILRYLIARPDRQASIDMLMADLWPNEEAETARHKLQVAVSALRCSLNRQHMQTPGGGYILCKDHVYQLNPDFEIHTDMASFLEFYQEGCLAQSPAAACALYERACQLYRGPFLVEDLYAEWSFLPREELSRTYLDMCGKLATYSLQTGKYEAVVAWAQAILKIDRCDESAYRLLMRSFAASGRRSEALRCYQQCQQALAEELDVQPMLETQQLLQTILHRA